MIGKLLGAFLGRKVKEKAVDTVLDRIHLPDPVESAIRTAATGHVEEFLTGAVEGFKEKKK